MKVVKTTEQRLTPPITIEFSGEEAEQLKDLMGAFLYSELLLMAERVDFLPFAASKIADNWDDLTDRLFDILQNHIGTK